MSDLRRMAVCVVEDEQRLRELLAREIRAMSYHAEGFRAAEDAWPRLERGDFDAAILDLNLPGEDGLSLYRRIHEADLAVDVVILTGFGALDSAVQALRWGAADYLTKPCSLAEIEVVLARLDRQRRNAEQTRRLALAKFDALETPVSRQASDIATPPNGKSLEELERKQILATLEQCDGNKSAAARSLGISLRTLYNKLGAYRAQGFFD